VSTLCEWVITTSETAEFASYGEGLKLQDPVRHRELSRSQSVLITGSAEREDTHITEAASNENILAAGKILVDRYRIEHVLGSGGMSVVYKASDLRRNRSVAVKVLHTHLNFQAKSLKRFQSEGKALSRLDHKHIVRVSEFGTFVDKTPFMVMEYVQGTTLAELLETETKLALERVLELALQICDALGHAHSVQIIHRDLKPSNIMVEVDKFGVQQTKMVDFGIAKVLSETHSEMTATGEVFGSPLYMSPEQCSGFSLDNRTDFYSLGCIIYECLTGFPPFSGESPLATMLKHQQDEPESLTRATLGEAFPAELERIVAKLLAKSPEQRYQRAKELAADLENIQLNGYNAVPLPSVPKSSVAADMLRSLQLQAAAEAGLVPGVQGRRDPLGIQKSKADAYVVVGLIICVLVVLIATVYFIPTLRNGSIGDSEGAQVVASTNTEAITQSDAMDRVDRDKKDEEKARLASERKSWQELIKSQPHSLRLKRYPELKDWTMLKNLPRLHTLDVSGSFFTDGDISYLRKLPLSNIDLTGVQVSGNLNLLKDCPSLIALNLSGNKLSAKDLAELNIRIRDLTLDNCEITDQGISNLVRLTNLRNLSLHDTPVTDKSILALSSLNLHSLNIEGSSITPAGIGLLKKNLQNCTILGE
jgi:predicted Ser/Thr protein kinase